MASASHHRLINKIRSIIGTFVTSYDPFADKLLEDFRRNPFYPFTTIDSFTFEYQYRRWTTIYFLIIIQILIVILTISCFSHFSSNEYWTTNSKWFFLISIIFASLFLCLNLIENLQRIRIVLSPINFHVSIYSNEHLKQRCSIDRAFICLHRVKSYNVVLYHLVFIIEDLEYLPISDYFSSKFPLRQIGKRLASNLFIGYFENEQSIGIFPKYSSMKTMKKSQS